MIRVGVVGLGRMGSRYPNARDGVPRSHIGAISIRDDMRVSALVDPHPAAVKETRGLFASLSDVPVWDSVEDMPEDWVDIIVISTPAESRLMDIGSALSKRPKLLLVEKPLALDSQTALQIAAMAENVGVPLRVNFHRRFDTAYRSLKAGAKGTPVKVVMYYNNGLFNYASHLVDFLLDWFGPVESVQALDKGVNPSFCCRLAAGFDAVIVGLDGLSYDQFEIQLIYQDRRIDLLNGGCQKRCQEPVDGLFYPGYSQLGPALEIGTDGPVGGLIELYDAAAKYIEDGGVMPGCDATQACQGLAVLEAVKASMNTGRQENLEQYQYRYLKN